jgi:hypothetical protein
MTVSSFVWKLRLNCVIAATLKQAMSGSQLAGFRTMLRPRIAECAPAEPDDAIRLVGALHQLIGGREVGSGQIGGPRLRVAVRELLFDVRERSGRPMISIWRRNPLSPLATGRNPR